MVVRVRVHDARRGRGGGSGTAPSIHASIDETSSISLIDGRETEAFVTIVQGGEAPAALGANISGAVVAPGTFTSLHFTSLKS